MSHQYLLTLAVVGLVLLGWVGCSADSGFKGNRPLYEQVIQGLRKGEIKTEQEKGVQIPEGSVRLPISARLPSVFQAASVGGEIYVSRPSTNQLLVVFKTWRGKGFNMEGFLYAAQPLSGAEITKDYYGHSVIVIGPMELVLEKQLDLNWYRVSYELD
ncbi:MAG: hypothetical protein ABSD29_23525 [Verrucomicrobiota bacterium]|jgi:hypothetical protein